MHKKINYVSFAKALFITTLGISSLVNAQSGSLFGGSTSPNKAHPEINLNSPPGIANPDSRMKKDPIEQKVLHELYRETLKPLLLDRIDYDIVLLQKYKKCVLDAQNPETYRLCENTLTGARRDKAEEITLIADKKRAALNQKYRAAESKPSSLFK